MNNVSQFLRCTLHLKRDDRLGNHLGRHWADDVHSKDFAVLRVLNNFHEALVRADDAGPRICGERELSDLHVVARFFALARWADAANLLMGRRI